MSQSSEVWVTGIGAHTAAGSGAEALRIGMRRERCLTASVPEWGGAVVARAPDPVIDRQNRRLDRSSQFFLAAAREAWGQADLGGRPYDPDRIAVIDGSSLGPMADMLAIERERARQDFRQRINPTQLIRMMFGAGGASFAQEIGAHGAVFALSAGSTSGALAIVEGWAKIRCGLADVVVAGGAEAPLDPEILAAFGSAGILAAIDQEMACRPFDITRCGTVLGEGAGVVVLENAAHARRRGAAPLAVLAGGGVSGEEGSMTAPDPRGAGIQRAVGAALAGSEPRRVGWIKAHGTGTKLNDAAECCALTGTLEGVPIGSLKPMLGHCLGASGAIELVATVIAISDREIPPTLGTTRVDPALGQRRVVLERETLRGSLALLLSQSLGGRCAALVLESVA